MSYVKKTIVVLLLLFIIGGNTWILLSFQDQLTTLQSQTTRIQNQVSNMTKILHEEPVADVAAEIDEVPEFIGNVCIAGISQVQAHPMRYENKNVLMRGYIILEEYSFALYSSREAADYTCYGEFIRLDRANAAKNPGCLKFNRCYVEVRGIVKMSSRFRRGDNVIKEYPLLMVTDIEKLEMKPATFPLFSIRTLDKPANEQSPK